MTPQSRRTTMFREGEEDAGQALNKPGKRSMKVRDITVGMRDRFVCSPIALDAMGDPALWHTEQLGTARRVEERLLVDCLNGETSTTWFKKDLPESFLVRVRARCVRPAGANTIYFFWNARNPDGAELLYCDDPEELKKKIEPQRPCYRVTFMGRSPRLRPTAPYTPGWSRIRRYPAKTCLSERLDWTIQVETNYDIICAKLGPRLLVYVNGEKVHDVVDTQPLPPGKFALRAWNSKVLFWGAELYELHRGDVCPGSSDTLYRIMYPVQDILASAPRFLRTLQIADIKNGYFRDRESQKDSDIEPLTNLAHVVEIMRCLGLLSTIDDEVRESWSGMLASTYDDQQRVFIHPKVKIAPDMPSLQKECLNHAYSDAVLLSLALLGEETSSYRDGWPPPIGFGSESKLQVWLKTLPWEASPAAAARALQLACKFYVESAGYEHLTREPWTAVLDGLDSLQSEETGFWGGPADPDASLAATQELCCDFYQVYGERIPRAAGILRAALALATPEGHFGTPNLQSVARATALICEMARRSNIGRVEEQIRKCAEGIVAFFKSARVSGGGFVAVPGKGAEPTLADTESAVHCALALDGLVELLALRRSVDNKEINASAG